MDVGGGGLHEDRRLYDGFKTSRSANSANGTDCPLYLVKHSTSKKKKSDKSFYTQCSSEARKRARKKQSNSSNLYLMYKKLCTSKNRRDHTMAIFYKTQNSRPYIWGGGELWDKIIKKEGIVGENLSKATPFHDSQETTPAQVLLK